MKILLAFPVADKQTGFFIQRAFESLGHKVVVVDAKVEPHQTFSVFTASRFDLVFCSRTPSLLSQVQAIKKISPVPIVCWNVDKRMDVNSFGVVLLRLFNEVDLFYTAALGNVEQYKSLCPDTIVKHLQQGCFPPEHDRITYNAADKEKYACDVMFAGSISKVHTGRESLLSKLQKSPLKVKLYGACNKTPKLLGEELRKAIACSTIVLGHSGMPSIEVGMSVRDYVTMACGGFLLTEYCLGMENWFNGMCAYYKTDQECFELIQYYLDNPRERQKLRGEGFREVHAHHKYIDRIKKVIVDVGELRAHTSTPNLRSLVIT